MKSRPTTRTRTVAAVAALALPALLTACGSGRDPLTYDDRDQADATEVSAGDLELVNLVVTPPADGFTHRAGSDARATFTVVNEGTVDDALVGVTSDSAQQVLLVLEEQVVDRLAVPAGDVRPTAVLLLKGLTRDVRTGETLTLTLSFERGPQREVRVAVAAPTQSPRPRASARTDLNEPAHGGGGEGGHGGDAGEGGH